MKIWIALVTVCLGFAVAGLSPVGAAEPTTAPATQPTACNTRCPVSKEAVDPKVPTIEYKGKIIGFCCEDCIKDFKSDPEKYMANLK